MGKMFSKYIEATRVILYKVLSCFVAAALCCGLTPSAAFSTASAWAEELESASQQETFQADSDASALEDASEAADEVNQGGTPANGSSGIAHGTSSGEGGAGSSSQSSESGNAGQDGQKSSASSEGESDSEEGSDEESNPKDSEDRKEFLEAMYVPTDEDFLGGCYNFCSFEEEGPQYPAGYGFRNPVVGDVILLDYDQDDCLFTLVYQVTAIAGQNGATENECTLGMVQTYPGWGQPGNGAQASAFGDSLQDPYKGYCTDPDSDGRYKSIPSVVEIPSYAGFGIYDEDDGIDFNCAFKVTTLADSAFAYNGSDTKIFSSIILPNTIKSIGTGTLSSGSSVFQSRTGLKSISIPSSVEEIHNGAFAASGLTSITIPTTLKKLGDGTEMKDGVFRGCSSLKTVKIEGTVSNPSQLESIGSYTFNGCGSLTTVEIGEGLDTTAPYMFASCSSLSSVTLPSSLESIGPYSFSSSAVSSITLPEGLTEIGDGAFSDCQGITGVGNNSNNTWVKLVFPSTLERVGKRAFAGCSNLRAIAFNPNVDCSLSIVDDAAFQGCSYLNTISNLPESITHLGTTTEASSFATGSRVFADCINFSGSIYLPASLKVLGSSAFAGCTQLRNVYFEEGVSIQGIHPYTFAGCSDLQYVLGSFDTSTEHRYLPESVKLIGDGAFDGCSNLQELELKEGLETLGTTPSTSSDNGSFVFRGCSKLFEMSLPSTLTTVGGNVFYGCSALQTVNLAPGIKSLGDYMFQGCANLTADVMIDTDEDEEPDTLRQGGAITLPASLGKDGGTVGTHVFYNCTGLTSDKLVFEEGYSVIGPHMFDGCIGLTSLSLPSTITTAGAYMLNGCENVNDLCIPRSLTSGAYMLAGSSVSILTFESGITVISDYLLAGYTALEDISLPDTLVEVGAHAFENCTPLTEINLSKVTKIGEAAFKGCTGLTEINLKSIAKASDIGKDAFAGTNIKRLTMPDVQIPGLSVASFAETSTLEYVDMGGITSLTAGLFEGCVALKTVVMRSITAIGDSTFEGCTSLESIDLQDVTSVGSKAFYNCKKITNIYLGGVTTIGAEAFYGCEKLAEANLASAESIGNNAFYGTNITRVTLSPAYSSLADATFIEKAKLEYIDLGNVTQVKANAFADCTSLVEVSMGSVNTIGSSAFKNCGKLTTLTFGSLSAIANSTFEGCSSLTSIDISGASSIGDNAFKNCSKLSTITGLSSVQSIGAYALSGCASLTSLNVSGATSIGDSAFEGLGITSVTIPSGLTGLGSRMFARCINLTSITLAEGTTTGDYMFADCTGLKTVVVVGPQEAVGERLFSGCTSLTRVSLGSSANRTDLGDYMFEGCNALTTVDLSHAGDMGVGAFKGCTGLTSVNLSTVATIGPSSFENCINLKSADLTGVTAVGPAAFKGCVLLESANLGSVVTISEEAFYNCKKLASVDLSSAVYIGRNAFYGCELLGEVSLGDIPSSNVGEGAFSGSNVTRIIIPNNTTTIGNISYLDKTKLLYVNLGGVTHVPENCFAGFTKLQTVDMPNVATVDKRAFAGCTSLVTVVTAQSLNSIGESAFEGCSSLFTIDLSPVSTIGNNAFKNCTSLKTVDVTGLDKNGLGTNVFSGVAISTLSLPHAFTIFDAAAFDGCHSIETIDMGGVITINANAFANNTTLKNINLRSVRIIGANAFEGCTGLLAIASNNVTTVGREAFSGCTNLASVSFPLLSKADVQTFKGCTSLATANLISVVTVENSAFENCSKLVTPQFGDIVFVGDDSFKGCRKLAAIDLSSTTEIGQRAFVDCDSLTDVDLSAADTIGDYAFAGCGLTTVEILRINIIGASTFEGCTKLETVVLGNMESIGNRAFANCTALSMVDMNDVMSIGDSAFNGCSSLFFIELGAVASIGSYAFAGCSSLYDANLSSLEEGGLGTGAFEGTSIASVTFPQTGMDTLPSGSFANSGKLTYLDLGGIKTVGPNAFKGCSSLLTVSMNSVTSVGESAFENCSKLIALDIYSNAAIGNNAFKGCSKLSIANLVNVASVGNSSFEGCSSLKAANLYNATSVGNRAFVGTAIENLVFSNKIASVGTSSFEGCTGLTSVSIPGTLKTVGEKAFSGCTGLVNVTLADGSAIGAKMFENCTGIASIAIPAVSSMGQNAFSGCTGLDTIDLSRVTVPFGLDAFNGCSIRVLTMPASNSSWQNIGDRAFRGWSSLETINLNGVESLGAYVFEGCTSLSTVDFGNVTSIGANAFSGLASLEHLNNLNGVATLGDHAFSGCNGITSVSIPNTVTTYGEGVFQGCTGLQSVSFAGGSTTTGKNMFQGCTSLATLTLPASFASIDESAFSGCTSLANVSLGGTKAIGEEAFNGCYRLSTIGLANVESIGNRAFNGCSAMANPDLSHATEIGGSAFYNCKAFTSVTVPASANIGEYAFKGCTKLTEASFPNALSIGTGAFMGTKVASVNLPESLGTGNGTISESAFEGCTELESVTLADSITTLPASAFGRCTSLVDINLGNVETIGEAAFEMCQGIATADLSSAASIGARAFEYSSLTSVALPSISELGEKAFAYNMSLETIDLTGEDETISALPNQVFAGCSAVGTVTLPSSIKSIGTDAFKGASSVGILEFKGIDADPQTSIPANGFAASGLTGLEKIVFHGTRLLPAGYSEGNPASGLFSGTGTVDTYVATYFYDGLDSMAEDEAANTFAGASGYVVTQLGEAYANLVGNAVQDIYESVGYFDDPACILNSDMSNVFVSSTAEAARVDGCSADTTARVYFFESSALSPTITLAQGPHSYTGSGIEPVESVEFAGKMLEEGQYEADYSGADNVNVGMASVTVYVLISDERASSATEEFEIIQADIEGVEIDEIDTCYADASYAHTPELTITYMDKALVKDVDYTAVYSNNTNIGTAVVDITGIGNFTGTTQTHFFIAGANIGMAAINPIANQTFTGNAITPDLTVVYTSVNTGVSTTLQKGTDYEIEYEDNVNAGTAKAIVKGINDYIGTEHEPVTFTIDPANISGVTGEYDGASADYQDIFVYTSEEIKPEPALTFNGHDLALLDEEGAGDYVLDYENNVDVGAPNTAKAPTIKVNGRNNFTGTATFEFAIEQKDISEGVFSTIYAQTYASGNEIRPDVTVTVDERQLTAEDVTFEYADNTKVGRAKVTATGKGNYKGTLSQVFLIIGKKLNDSFIASIADQTYSGFGLTPEVSLNDGVRDLVKDTDFEVAYASNVNVADHPVVTVTGKGNYSGTATSTFTIEPQDITDSTTVRITSIDTPTYTGAALSPAVSVNDSVRDADLVKDADFTVAYENNVNASSVTGALIPTVTIEGTGNYEGQITGHFTINPRAIDASGVTYTPIGNHTYTGYEIKPTMTIRDGNTRLVEGTDFDIDYTGTDNTNVGTVAPTVRGKNNYTSSRTDITFDIVQKSLSGVITFDDIDDQPYNLGNQIQPEFVARFGEFVLDSDDFDVTYTNNTEVPVDSSTASMPTITITGKGNFTGTAATTFNIVPKATDTGDTSIEVQGTYTYNGSAIVPTIVVTDTTSTVGAEITTKTLVEGTDYTKAASQNVNAGAATVTITGKGNYEDALSQTFTIDPKNLAESSVAFTSIETVTYNGADQSPAFTVEDSESGATLTESDFDVAYTNRVNACNADATQNAPTITLTGKGNYTGTKADTFTIQPKDIASATVTIDDIESVTYNGSDLRPSFKVNDSEAGAQLGDNDFAFDYAHNNLACDASATENAPTIIINGKGNYTGEASKTFTISNKSVDDSTLDVVIEACTYNGSALTPGFTITDTVRNQRLESEDFTYDFVNNVNAAKKDDSVAPSLVIRGKGNYGGETTKTFTIDPRDLAVAVATSGVAPIASEVYTGSDIEPAVSVKDVGLDATLELDKDFTVAYASNKYVADIPVVTITGKGNYTNFVETTFSITPKPLQDSFVAEVSGAKYTYSGAEITPGATVTDDVLGPLALDTDYTVSYFDNVDASMLSDEDQPTLIVQGKGNYTGRIDKYFSIDPKDISLDEVAISNVQTLVYTGSALSPTFDIADNGRSGAALVPDKDFTVSYSNNVNVNSESYKPTISIDGKGNYVGNRKVDFNITPKSIQHETVSVDPISSLEYTGFDLEPTAVVKDSAIPADDEGNSREVLVDGRDYTLTYDSNKNFGTATVTITGAGNYAGTSRTTTFQITQRSIDLAMVNELDMQEYDGSEHKPTIVMTDTAGPLVEGTDFSVTYGPDVVNVNVVNVTITGMGNYNSTKTTQFTIGAKSISSANIDTSGIGTLTYDGTEKKPEPVVTIMLNGTNATLVKDTDYELSYSSNTEAGASAVMTITGKGNYGGMKSANFTIEQWDISTDSTAKVTGISSVTYDRTAHEQNPVVTVGGRTLVKGTEYTVSYANNVNACNKNDTSVDPSKKPSVTVTGTGNFKGSITTAFTINQKSLSTAAITNVENKPYTGAAISQTGIYVKVGTTDSLTEGTDFEVTYKNNVNVGTATLTVTGINNYKGSASVDFQIEPLNIQVGGVVGLTSQVYTGQEIKPLSSTEFTGVVLRGVKLVYSRDYTVTYANNTNVGTASYTLNGIGNFTGSLTGNTFAITQKSIDDSTVKIADIAEQFYDTDRPVTPSVTVTDQSRGVDLVLGTDYTVAYADNVEHGPATVIVSGINNYGNTATKGFTIAPKRVSSSDITVTVLDECTYDGTNKTPRFTVKDGTKVLEADKDFTFDYENNVLCSVNNPYNPGTPTIDLEGMGNYQGKRGFTFTIKPKSLEDAIISGTQTVVYDGTPQTFDITANLDGVELENGKDFTVSYENNVNAAKSTASNAPKVVISGKGNYTDQTKAAFTISPKPLDSKDIEVSDIAAQEWTGQAITPTISMSEGSHILESGVDYTVQRYFQNTEPGPTAQILLTGNGNYAGKKVINFTIVKNVSYLTVSKIANQTWTGKALTPAVTVADGSKVLTANTDYVLSYGNNVNPGTATVEITGIGSYEGSVSTTFVIMKSMASLNISNIGAQTYTGSAIKPAVTVKDGGSTISASNYNISYSNNVNVGTASVTITGKNSYTGSKTLTFKINPKSIAGRAVTPPGAVTYSGAPFTPAVSVAGLSSGRDYTVSYANNTNAGTASVTITGKGNYTGSLSTSFTINKAPQSISGLKTSNKFKAKDLKKKKKTFALGGTAAGGAVTFKVKEWKKAGKITVKKCKKAVKVAANGTVTVAKKTAKGKYTLVVIATAAAGGNYETAETTFNLTVTVK